MRNGIFYFFGTMWLITSGFGLILSALLGYFGLEYFLLSLILTMLCFLIGLKVFEMPKILEENFGVNLKGGKKK